MGKRILITGGAGSIGSHLADELLAHGDERRRWVPSLGAVWGACSLERLKAGVSHDVVPHEQERVLR